MREEMQAEEQRKDLKHQDLICNACGQPIKQVGPSRTEDYLYVEKKWNYFSAKDLTIHSFIVCEACYDKWIKSFAIEVKEESVIEIFDFID